MRNEADTRPTLIDPKPIGVAEYYHSKEKLCKGDLHKLTAESTFSAHLLCRWIFSWLYSTSKKYPRNKLTSDRKRFQCQKEQKGKRAPKLIPTACETSATQRRGGRTIHLQVWRPPTKCESARRRVTPTTPIWIRDWSGQARKSIPPLTWMWSRSTSTSASPRGRSLRR